MSGISEAEKQMIIRSDRSASEVARRFGVTERSVFRYWKEAGRPGRKSLKELKAILGEQADEPFTRAG